MLAIGALATQWDLASAFGVTTPSVPLAHRDAAEDPALRGAPIAVYDFLIYRLEPAEFRWVKVTGLAQAMRIKTDTASRSLKVLTERGYLERKYVARSGYQYRLRVTRYDPLSPLNGTRGR